MGWKIRRGRRYYYHSERVGRKVVTRYVGAGAAGQIAADMVAGTRQAKEALSASLHAYRRLLPSVLDAHEWIQLIVSGALVLGGRFVLAEPECPSACSAEENCRMPNLTQFHWLCKCASDGRSEAIDRLISLLSQASARRRADELSNKAISSLIEVAVAGDKLGADSRRTSLEKMRADLLGTSPTWLERIAVARIQVAWLDADLLIRISHLAQVATSRQIKFLFAKRTAADRRLKTAMDSLTTVRSAAERAAQRDPLRVLRPTD